jgi:hypothetical protein
VDRFFINSLLPAVEQLSRHIDLNTVAIFGVDDSKVVKYLYFSPAEPGVGSSISPLDAPFAGTMFDVERLTGSVKEFAHLPLAATNQKADRESLRITLPWDPLALRRT